MDAIFTQTVKNIIEYSKNEAIRLNSGYIGETHLLLGILVSKALDNFLIENHLISSISELKSKIEAVIIDENMKNRDLFTLDSLPLTKTGEKVMRISILEAKGLKSEKIEPVHIFLSILRHKDSTVVEILKEYSIDYQKIKNILVNEMPRNIQKDRVLSLETLEMKYFDLKNKFKYYEPSIENLFEPNIRKIISKIEEKLKISLFETNPNGSSFALQIYDNKVIGIKFVLLEFDLSPIIIELQKLSYLECIEIIQCKVTNISSISELQNLSKLTLKKLNLDSVLFLARLNQLKLLDLEGNKLNNTSEIIKIVDNNKLEYINLFYNQFNEIPELLYNFLFKALPTSQLIKDLKNSTVANQQFEIAAELRDIENKILIKKIQATNEEIAYIHSSFFHYLTKTNPITEPPVSILDKGDEAIKRYYHSIKSQGLDFIYEAKLTLVGDGACGKTSLQLRLVDKNAILPTENIRTRGIDVTDWKFKTANGIDAVAHIWDFGGQDMYYPVHRFFITENSVFILLSSTRFAYHNFDYWIPTIFQFGNNSPIIIGQTCHEGLKKRWNDIGKYLSNEHFNIVKNTALSYTELNLPNDNYGLSEIKDLIINQLSSLGKFGKSVPKSYIEIKQELKEHSIKNTCISLDTFTKICRKINPADFDSYFDVVDCCSFFRDIGALLWYPENPFLRNWIILQPEWAMNAVYKFIDDLEIQDRKGHITNNDFARLWRDEYIAGKADLLKLMIENFKIAFPKKHDSSQYILPVRLESIPEEMQWINIENALSLEYIFEFMPKGLVNQLSAELSRYIVHDSQVWNNAVNLKYRDDDTISQVIEVGNKIKIIVKGKEARDLLALIKNSLIDITDEYKNLKPFVCVPCSCSICGSNNNPQKFDYARLLEWNYKRDNATVFCNESGESLYIEELLFNVALDSGKTNMVMNDLQLKRKPRFFVSYSKSDEEYLLEFLQHFKDDDRIEVFYDREAVLNNEAERKLLNEIDKCDYFICLVSQAYLKTDFIIKKEIPTAINSKKILVPIILKPCNWEKSPISDCQVILKGKTITIEEGIDGMLECTKNSPAQRDYYWLAAVKEINRKII